MTLIEVDGIGRCDARCYDATGGKCRCVCLGANHGVGLVRAEEKVAKRLPGLTSRYGPRLRVSERCLGRLPL